MSRDLEKAISDAVEASYYVAPEAPGLKPDELATVLAPRYQPGEIGHALNHTMQNLHGSANGYVFANDEHALPISLTRSWVPFPEDPRDWTVFAFVHNQLKEIARAKGPAQAKLGLSEIRVETEARGIDLHQISLAIHGLSLMGLATLDASTNKLVLTSTGFAYGPLDAKLNSDGPHYSRSTLPALIEAVRSVRERREPAVRWRELRSELAALGAGDELKNDELRVLDDICVRFADTAEAVSLDDVVRRIPEIEVRLVANGLEQNQMLHVRSDKTVLPSLLALHRHLDLFAELFQGVVPIPVEN